MIRPCNDTDIEVIYSIINEAARVYKGVIPEDRWKEPYMSQQELQFQINAGVVFWGYEEGGELVAVMGIQHVKDVSLIRHAYVRPRKQNRGIGRELLFALYSQTERPMLIGTWASAVWAIRFYKKNGFQIVSPRQKDRLLEKYWSIPARQVETSVVLADRKWFDLHRESGPLA